MGKDNRGRSYRRQPCKSRQSCNPRKDLGFTLVEVLIAMFIFSLITVGSMTALTNALRGKAQLTQKITQLTELELARVLIKSDLSNIVLPVSRDAFGSPERFVLTGGISELVRFTRAGRLNPGGLEARGDLERVSYVFEEGNVIRRALSQAYPAPNTPVKDRVLIRDVQSIDMQFYFEDEKRDIIEISAGASQAVPNIVELDLVFSNGDRLVQLFELNL